MASNSFKHRIQHPYSFCIFVNGFVSTRLASAQYSLEHSLYVSDSAKVYTFSTIMFFIYFLFASREKSYWTYN
ncbi:hypothetical protein BY458DRAFT_505344 [Sporodiniella umbellata]|nr:hypothetical protein BY458DRAFT_505344 [Sporodiniella umbellata]